VSLDFDKYSWKRVSVSEVIRHVTDRVDAETSGLKRFLAGEHIPSNSLAITNWGVIGKDPIGPMFYKRFKPGHVLYVSRRTYLRKVAVPEFEGITGEKTFVLETSDPRALLQEFLPFVLSAERFHTYAVANSRGSVNPYLNWGELAGYEFALPPVGEQKRIADLLWAIEDHRRELLRASRALLEWRMSYVADTLESRASTVVPLESLIRSGTKITYGIVQAGPEMDGGVPYIRVSDMTDGVLSLDGMRRTSHEIAAKFRRSQVDVGDLVVALRGRTGLTLTVPPELDGANLTQGTARVSIAAAEVEACYVAAVMNSSWMATEISRRAKGSTFTELTLVALRNLPIPRLGRVAEQLFVSVLDVVDETAGYLEKELMSVAGLKSSIANEIFGDN
jgi:type I restriction enzyme, S subunit